MATAKCKFSRGEYRMLAEIADQLEQYEDMAVHMKAIAEKFKDPFDENERNMFSIAFKNQIRAKRTQQDQLDLLLEQWKGKEHTESMCKVTKSKLQQEVMSISEEVLKLLNEKLIPKAKSTDDKIFYAKMRADYYKYMSEVVSESDSKKRGEILSNAGKNYADAMKMAESNLPAFHPIRLGVILNYAVFKYENLKNKKSAFKFLKDAYEGEALNSNGPTDAHLDDSRKILDLMRDNIIFWQEELEESGLIDIVD